jgi:hypothetical protein
LPTLASRAAEVTLVNKPVFVDDDKRERVSVVEELVELRAPAAQGEFGLDAVRKRTRARPRGYPPVGKSVLVAHIRLAPDHRAGDRGVVGR